MEFEVATKVKDGTITSSPALIPNTQWAICNAAVAFDTANACFTTRCSANSFSNCWVTGPIESHLDFNTLVTASISLSPKSMSDKGIFHSILALTLSPIYYIFPRFHYLPFHNHLVCQYLTNIHQNYNPLLFLFCGLVF